MAYGIPNQAWQPYHFNMAHLDVESLELLISVGVEGSVSKAASRCGMAQPNATRMLARLERAIGQTLLIRSATGSRLTETGALVAQWAAPVVSASQDFHTTIAALTSTRGNQLRIMASQTVAECYAPAWIADYQRKHAGAAVQMSVHNSARIMTSLLNGDDRLGIVESATIMPGLSALPVGSDQMVVVAPADHPWAHRGTPLDLATVALTPLVVREEGSGTREVLDQALKQLNPVPPSLIVSSNAAVLGSVAAGAGPAVISRRAASSAIATHRIIEIPISRPEMLRRTLHAVWPTSTPLLGASSDFLALVVHG